MRRSRELRRVAAMATAAAALAVVPAAASQSVKSCGVVRSGSDRLHVRVISGSVSCAEARKVASKAMSGGGRRIGKWQCDGGAGGIGCTKRAPPGRILATV